MIIECENIRLCLVQETDLEMMRQWRNADHVNREMEFRAIIDEESQRRWFNELDKKTNFYFRLDVADVPIGVLNLKNIDWKNKTAEAGIFIGEQSHLGTMSPVLSVIVMMQFAYDILALDALRAKIADSNTNAIHFNQQLGYKVYQSVNPGFTEFNCDKHSFYDPSSTIAMVGELIKRHSQIKISIGRDMEWLLPQMNLDHEGYQFLLL